MASTTFKCEFPRRQAMLDIWTEEFTEYGGTIRHRTGEKVPVLVWPMPTSDGFFIIEHQTGRCQKVQPHELTFLGSKELFDQYDWSEHA